MGVRVGVANFFFYQSIGIVETMKIVGVKGGVSNFFLGQSIGIDKNNTFQFKFLF